MELLSQTIMIFRQLPKPAALLFCCGTLLLPRAAAGDITAVSSRVSDGYARTKLADGSFQPETYAFGEGGHLSGSTADETIDKLKFIEVARTITGPLAGQQYLPAKDPKQTKLLIMVYWGTTTGSAEDPTLPNTNDVEMKLMFRSQRDHADVRNARLLGYDAEDIIGTDYGRGLLLTALHRKTEDLLDEIEDNRYFVVLMAYDFQLLWKEKKHKLLWETRFSIRENRNDFGKVLPDMAQFASRYFGRDTHGLVRKPLKENVNLGELKILGVEPNGK